jgi:hypothetical protein
MLSGLAAAVWVHDAARLIEGTRSGRAAAIRVEDAACIPPEFHEEVPGQAEGAGYLTAGRLAPDRRGSEDFDKEKRENEARTVGTTHGVPFKAVVPEWAAVPARTGLSRDMVPPETELIHPGVNSDAPEKGREPASR